MNHFLRSHLKIILTIMVLSVSIISTSHSTPPTVPKAWKTPVIAYIVYPAGYSPDENGRFEIEIFCEAVYDIKKLSIDVAYSEKITFDEKTPRFNGSLKRGESKV